MSQFKVLVEEIKEVKPHPNADRLELATLTGRLFQFVIAKGQYQPGDLVVYFPVDSLLPAWIVARMGLTGRLSGKGKNRVKTVRLRGELSQGLVCKPEDLDLSDVEYKQDLTKDLNVTKWEPVPIMSKSGQLVALPHPVSKYDIESVQNFSDLISDDTEVVITEKLEGSHWGLTAIYSDKTEAYEFTVFQRNYAIKPVDGKEHTWIKLADPFTEKLAAILLRMYPERFVQSLTIRGEAIGPGIQGNHYKLKDHEVRIFEMEIDGVPIHWEEFYDFCEYAGIPMVPKLYVGKLGDLTDDLVSYSNGKSKIANVRREGIVIRPTKELFSRIGRVILKVRSPEYLAKSEL